MAQLDQLSDLALQKHYLNLLDWTESVALVAGLVTTEAAALRLVQLGLEVDLYLGARLAGEVPSQFQAKTLALLSQRSLPSGARGALEYSIYAQEFG
ncbi:MAG: hypothetical protein F6K30_28705 [Cyanothece sp. SIO2G6]|nr:hypothetical protein [Cyanothece sp. SIO2G6]